MEIRVIHDVDQRPRDHDSLVAADVESADDVAGQGVRRAVDRSGSGTRVAELPAQAIRASVDMAAGAAQVSRTRRVVGVVHFGWPLSHVELRDASASRVGDDHIVRAHVRDGQASPIVTKGNTARIADRTAAHTCTDGAALIIERWIQIDARCTTTAGATEASQLHTQELAVQYRLVVDLVRRFGADDGDRIESRVDRQAHDHVHQATSIQHVERTGVNQGHVVVGRSNAARDATPSPVGRPLDARGVARLEHGGIHGTAISREGQCTRILSFHPDVRKRRIEVAELEDVDPICL